MVASLAIDGDVPPNLPLAAAAGEASATIVATVRRRQVTGKDFNRASGQPIQAGTACLRGRSGRPANSAEIARRLRRLPVLGLLRASFRASATVSAGPACGPHNGPAPL